VHGPFAAVASRIEHFQHDLVNRNLGPEESERLSRLQNRMSLLLYLEDSLRGLTATIEPVSFDGKLGTVISSLVETLDFVLLTLIEALEANNDDSLELLLEITADRGDMMEKVRQDFLADEAQLLATDRAILLQSTSIFERIIWMAQRLARLVGSNQAAVVAG
jgi:phosphate:Na+ symporter